MLLAPYTPSEHFFIDDFDPPGAVHVRPLPTPDDILRTRRAFRAEDLREPVRGYSPREAPYHATPQAALRIAAGRNRATAPKPRAKTARRGAE